jgi:metal-responsive CopG/Arc/MetJ family transcriptional regulator
MRQEGTTLFIPSAMHKRLERIASKKGLLNWSELARTLLENGLTEEEKIFLK